MAIVDILSRFLLCFSRTQWRQLSTVVSVNGTNELMIAQEYEIRPDQISEPCQDQIPYSDSNKLWPYKICA
jgi:hypothetical protein